MDMIILNSNTKEISFISGESKLISRSDVENFSFREDPSVEQTLVDEYNSANEEYANVISNADEVFLNKKAVIEKEYNESVRHSMEIFSGDLSDAEIKKSKALESLCLEKEKLLKVSSEKLKLAKDRLTAYRENVKRLQENEALKETFLEEDRKAADLEKKSSQVITGVSTAYAPIKPSGSGKLKF